MTDRMSISSVHTADYKLLWAKSKPRHPLWKHLLDASAVSTALPPPVNNFGWGVEETALLVGLHDIGKADSCFQHQIPDFSDELVKARYPVTGDAPCRHERISAMFIKHKLIEGGLDPLVADAVARTVLAHHGYWYETARPVGQAYADAQNQLCRMLRQVLGLNAFPSKSPSDLSAFGMRFAGHIVLCDWIASNEGFFGDARLRDVDDPEDYFTTARKLAQDWVRRLGLERDRQAGKAACIVEIARPIQQTLLDRDIPPGLVIIEAPMGEGKTEAAWILAEKWRDNGYNGMYMALPTMATSDSLYRRYRDDYLKRVGRGGDTKLVHGMAWLRDEKEPEKPSEVGEPGDDRSLAAAWFRPTRRAMLAAHGVGTVDQAMLAGMNVKFGFLRLYGLADRVLVIDEVHAYDAYMSAIISRLLQWCACLKIPVVLLSATLSAKQRAEMIEAYGAKGDPGPDASYPLITVAEPGKKAWTIKANASSSRTLKIETHSGLLGDAKKTAEKAAELVKDGGCCCVILNTVKQAQAVYTELELYKEEKLLFHARFAAADREHLTDEVLAKFGKNSSRRPSKFVLVATQVVEQSLDVDFDYMVSEIAPIDLLLQRSGRLHRHGRREYDPTLHVLLPKKKTLSFGGTGYVYADKPLLRTLAILAGRCEVHLPNDFRILIERCYGSYEWEQSVVTWEAIRKADLDWDTETQFLHNQGRQFALCDPSKRLFRPVNNDPTGDDSDDGNGWRAKTRLGANDRTTVLVEEEQLKHLETGDLRMKEVRALYRRSLKLPVHLPIHSPAPGYSAAVDAKGKLRGLTLLPVADYGLWQGIDEKGNRYEVVYNKELGLLAGRVQ
ncbi:MAG: CRISPR-associated helicase Cas3' [Deltaproteobacteria bacterium]|nr:CRISPR-associated helicase Cas3' [Deltaproteobacteria bacterium]